MKQRLPDAEQLEPRKGEQIKNGKHCNDFFKAQKILKGSLDSILSPSRSCEQFFLFYRLLSFFGKSQSVMFDVFVCYLMQLE